MRTSGGRRRHSRPITARVPFVTLWGAALCRICVTGNGRVYGILAPWREASVLSTLPTALEVVLLGGTEMTTPTENDVMAVQDKLAELYATLPPAQQEVLDTILAAGMSLVGDDDTSGFILVNSSFELEQHMQYRM